MFLMKRLALTALIGATTLAAIPTEAEARHRHHRNSYYSDRGHDRWHDRRDYRHHRDKRYYRNCRTSGTTGLIVGGAAGALLGREVDRRGDRATGTILGAAGGALLGREIDRKRRC
ncbi:glycine zipper 2TM domain-containing protein [Sphingopyxis sp. MSC1_008]|jgi:hypothetical protein|uniref:glycine zipper 2TM domain-containing protein n=1 Tax=Sphingopyxis sp. MSC1_008 TaxID=2909265 RepID=UPI0020BDE04C|nr:glycine zipper 2TM domain-containing protein [Sphingopyxis sp. MSC1_008]